MRFAMTQPLIINQSFPPTVCCRFLMVSYSHFTQGSFVSKSPNLTGQFQDLKLPFAILISSSFGTCSGRFPRFGDETSILEMTPLASPPPMLVHNYYRKKNSCKKHEDSQKAKRKQTTTPRIDSSCKGQSEQTPTAFN